MTPKTKVLKILDQYRDMRLTMGCEVKSLHNESTVIFAGLNKEGRVLIDNKKNNAFIYAKEWDIKDIEILGHPATPLVLLKAIQQADGHWMMKTCGERIEYVDMTNFGNQHFKNKYIGIPDVTTLSEVPEEHKMWQAVLAVLI